MGQESNAAPDLLQVLQESLKSLELAAALLEVPAKSAFRENMADLKTLIEKIKRA